MKSDEEQIIDTLTQFYNALDTRNQKKLDRFLTDTFITKLPNYTPILKKKYIEVIGILYSNETKPVKEKRKLQSTKIQVSKMGDIAMVWSIHDVSINNVLIETFLSLIGMEKIDNVWYIDSTSVHEVEVGWRW